MVAAPRPAAVKPPVPRSLSAPTTKLPDVYTGAKSTTYDVRAADSEGPAMAAMSVQRTKASVKRASARSVTTADPAPGSPPVLAPKLKDNITQADVPKSPKSDPNLLDLQYQYRDDIPDYEGCPMAAFLPTAEYFSLAYIFGRFKDSKAAIITALVNSAAERFVERSTEHNNFKDYKEYFPPYYIFKLLFFRIPLRWFLPETGSTLFRQLPDLAADLPLELPGGDDWLSDESFAEQRLSGMNPTVIRALEPGDPRLDKLAGIELPVDINALAAKGKAFVCDYTGDSDTPSGTPDWHLPDCVLQGGIDADSDELDEGRRRHLPRALAWFYWDDAKDRLLPLAVKIKATEHVYTPADAHWNWMFAKLCVQTCDGNHHELTAHLGRCHLAMEPFALSTRRMLPEGHPIHLLLMPHTRFMMHNNELGRRVLIAPKGAVDELMCGTLSESNQIAAAAIRNFDFASAALPKEVAAKGVGKENIPRYAYRDDGLLVYDAIKKYLTEYVDTTYGSASKIKGDEELQAWAEDIATFGSVTGMPKRIESAETLVDILATVLYIFSAEHCAVNFSQESLGGFVPNMPLQARDSYLELAKRGGKESIKEQELARYMPSRYKARKQVETMMILSAYRFDKLGYYDDAFQSLYNMNAADVYKYYKLPKLADVNKRFQADLDAVTLAIDANQSVRLGRTPKVDYRFLYPENLLNSICI